MRFRKSVLVVAAPNCSISSSGSSAERARRGFEAAAGQLVRHRLSRAEPRSPGIAAALLERLMVYEAVHEIRGWTDLKNRLDADRRCLPSSIRACRTSP
jgi:hypothetical protein